MENGNLREQVLFTANADPRKCMKCGKCSGACPNYDEMEYHPHQFVSMVLNGDVEPLMHSKSLWMCLGCMVCTERCPRDVKPARFIEAVRLMQIRQQGENHLKPEDVSAKIEEDTPQQLLVSAFRKYAK